MKRAAWMMAALLAASPAWAGGGEKVAWDKADTAPAKAQASGKPILYYFLVTQSAEKGKAGTSC